MKRHRRKMRVLRGRYGWAHGRRRGHAFWTRRARTTDRDVAMRTWWAIASQRAPDQVLRYKALMATYRGAPGQFAERQALLAQIKTTMASHGVPYPDDNVDYRHSSGVRPIR